MTIAERFSTITKVETGTYNLYQSPKGAFLEVFQVTKVSADDPSPLTVGKYYYQPSDGDDPVGPFDTEQAALDAAY